MRCSMPTCAKAGLLMSSIKSTPKLLLTECMKGPLGLESKDGMGRLSEGLCSSVKPCSMKLNVDAVALVKAVDRTTAGLCEQQKQQPIEKDDIGLGEKSLPTWPRTTSCSEPKRSRGPWAPLCSQQPDLIFGPRCAQASHIAAARGPGNGSSHYARPLQPD